ncbi:beta-ketoacyl-[acyl-carrier-protein] synthase family protein [Kitasatospora purpeofusca]|uniref:beta-ketoacyl-[acyl-carrier-protein] synthase family protein n=1 Tax=Kitasatospora purpeofusca TaxID=67352 RepID=UPI003692088D
MTPRQVVVTGLGAVSSAGIGTKDNWARMLAAAGTASADPQLAACPTNLTCRVPGFDPATALGAAATRLDRYAQLAVLAADEAWASAGLDAAADPTRCAAVMGTANGGLATLEARHIRFLNGDVDATASCMPMALPSSAATTISLRLGLLGGALGLSTACTSGTAALGTALAMIRAGTADVVLAGGAEAPLTRLAAFGYSRLGALSRRTSDPAGASRPFAADRDGFVLAEGAGVLVLEAAEHALARGARPMAVVAGYGQSADGHHPLRPHPEGDGALRAMTAALVDAGLVPGDIGHVNAHATSTPLGDASEARAIAKLFGDRTAVSSTKGVTGHPMGASGALEAAYTVLALRHQLIPPTANLHEPQSGLGLDLVSGRPRPGPLAAAISNSFGFGGSNACLVLTLA